MRTFNVIEAKKRILQGRTEADLSQEELGGRFGMSRAGYSAAENPTNAKVFFTHGQILNIKYELGMSYDWIFEGINSPLLLNKNLPDQNMPENVRVAILESENKSLKDQMQTKDILIQSLQSQIQLLQGKKD